MFRAGKGLKAHYHYLTLLISADFDEWKVLLQGPGLTIHAGRQFTEETAKAHALLVAKGYVHEEKQEDLPVLENIGWSPLEPGEWLNWRP